MPINKYVVENDNIFVEGEEGDIKDNCSICLSKGHKNEFIKMKCGHSFHINCIKKWLLTQENLKYYNPNDNITLEGSCPLCRKKCSYIFMSDNDDESFNNNIPYSIIVLRLLWRFIKR
jgi:hypothetical protein